MLIMSTLIVAKLFSAKKRVPKRNEPPTGVENDGVKYDYVNELEREFEIFETPPPQLEENDDN